MWSNCTLPHCDWTFLDGEEEFKSQVCGKWEFNSLARKFVATGKSRFTVRCTQFTIPLTSILYKWLDWSLADPLFTHFHNVTWQFWKLIFHSVGMFKTTYYIVVQNQLPTNGISSKAGFANRSSGISQKLIPNKISKFGIIL